jgi:hypothetical protein
MQSIEIYTPWRDAEGHITGINQEGIFYDSEALVEPIRIIRNLYKVSDLDKLSPFVFIECTPTIFPFNGLPTPVAPGAAIEYRVPDLYDRPWARVWEQFHEQGMQRPAADDIFKFD